MLAKEISVIFTQFHMKFCQKYTSPKFLKTM